MKPAQPLALVTPGALSTTPFASFPGLARLVTHVWAPTLRITRRIANRMYFAHACAERAELRPVKTLLICDAGRLPQIESLHSDWTGRIVLLAFDPSKSSSAQQAANRFRERGAKAAVLSVLDEFTPCRFFAEGDAAATSVAGQLFSSAGGNLTVVAPGSLAHVQAARFLTGPVFLGLLESVNQHLRLAHIPLIAIRELAGRLVAETVRVHQRSGARKWRASEADTLAGLALAIAESDAALAKHLHLSAAAVQAFFTSPDVSRRARQSAKSAQTLGFIGGKSRAGQAD